ncbi:NusA N-terminal domain-containing protein [Mycoplasmopsis iners]|uniref:NusA N-terminal domain-containing protein n=1 Tax=Mycoplasmopsis iners TaxID=76630 RepID=UPI0004959BCE|nr:NusA N-terminal domain-containing protein [Mycoplasmopsis iners]
MSKTKNAEINKSLDQEKNYFKTIAEYASAYNCPIESVVEVFQNSITNVIRKNIDPEANIVIELDKRSKIAKMYNTEMMVVEDEDNEADEVNSGIVRLYNIGVSEAQLYQTGAKEGDIIKAPIDLSVLMNADIQYKNYLRTIFSTIVQGMKILQKRMVYEKYSQLIGQNVLVEFISKNKNNSWNVKIIDENNQNGITGYLPKNSISNKRKINLGERHSVVIESVQEESSLSQIIVSLDNPAALKNELIQSIPEINDGLIEIVEIQRQAGERSKVAVKKTDPNSDFDLHGAVIGMRGSRIGAISRKLDNERIDVIEYSDDLKTYIANAMSPAKVVDVVAKDKGENKNQFFVIVPNDGITPAIGAKGINSTLASQLTKAVLEIIDVKQADELGLEYNKNNLFNEVKETIKIKPINRIERKPRINRISNAPISMDTFDSDVAAFELEEQESNDKFYDLNFEELFEQHARENAEQEIPEEVKEEIVDVKNELEDYKKAKKVIQDFKVDTDLANFGLDVSIDLDEFNDEDWD